MTVPLYAAVLAAAPIVVLAVAVLASRVTLGVAAWGLAAGTAALAVTVFGMTPVGLAGGAAKGFWTGLWILAIVVPALLLFQVSESSGAFDRLSEELRPLTSTPGHALLLLAWVFPSFLQGAAGFGVPVVVAAPMLVRAGFPAVTAVAACLVGYHWSVTFGSMGSSFFVAAGTAQLDAASTREFALRAAGLLTVNALAAALLLLRRERAADAGTVWRACALTGVMGAVLIGTVLVQPALGSTAAGLAGLLAAGLLLSRRGDRPAWGPMLAAAAPYLALTGMVVAVFGIPALRTLAGHVPPLALSFPDTTAAFGHVNAAVFAHQPFRPLLHAGPYVLLAALAGAWLFRRYGWLKPGSPPVVGPWLGRTRSTAVSLLGLTTLAGIMVDAGMVSAVAQALAAGLGAAYPVVAPAIGALGTVLTGSTTASNALLAPLQSEAATRLGIEATTLLAAQAAGGNVGNAVTPLNALVAAAAVGAAGAEGAVLRRALRDALPLLAVLTTGVVLLTWLA